MNKDVFLLGVCLVVLAGGGGYHYYASAQSKPSAVGIANAKNLLADKSSGKNTSVPAAHSSAPATDADLKKQAAANQAARAQTESALAAMKVSSILLGDPAIVIISKHEYSVGDPFVLPGKQSLKVTAITQDGVTLAANGQAYHLDPPAAPDLAASRKK